MGTSMMGLDAPLRRTALLGLGSNVGDRVAMLQSATADLAATPGIELIACSRVYESPAMGSIEQGDFLNAAIRIETSLSPGELLAAALAIEAAHGRERRVRWGPRTLDIDVLWVAGVKVDEPGLSIPHPGLAERPFVLRPVAEVMPELVLEDGRRVVDAAKELNDDACVCLPSARLVGSGTDR